MREIVVATCGVIARSGYSLIGVGQRDNIGSIQANIKISFGCNPID
jgi:hypothetical protein